MGFRKGGVSDNDEDDDANGSTVPKVSSLCLSLLPFIAFATVFGILGIALRSRDAAGWEI